MPGGGRLGAEGEGGPGPRAFPVMEEGAWEHGFLHGSYSTSATTHLRKQEPSPPLRDQKLQQARVPGDSATPQLSLPDKADPHPRWLRCLPSVFQPVAHRVSNTGYCTERSNKVFFSQRRQPGPGTEGRSGNHPVPPST